MRTVSCSTGVSCAMLASTVSLLPLGGLSCTPVSDIGLVGLERVILAFLQTFRI